MRDFTKKYFHLNSSAVYNSSAKNSQNLSISHAISANPASIKKFFENLRKWVADWKLEAEPNRIWNVDECRVGHVQKHKR